MAENTAKREVVRVQHVKMLSYPEDLPNPAKMVSFVDWSDGTSSLDFREWYDYEWSPDQHRWVGGTPGEGMSLTTREEIHSLISFIGRTYFKKPRSSASNK